MQLHHAPIPTTRFTWIKETRTFVADRSDFSDGELVKQLYDDAADVGFLMINPKTQASVAFYFSEVEKDAEGETVAWIFIPIGRYIRKHPKLSGVCVRIFND